MRYECESGDGAATLEVRREDGQVHWRTRREERTLHVEEVEVFPALAAHETIPHETMPQAAERMGQSVSVQ